MALFIGDNMDKLQLSMTSYEHIYNGVIVVPWTRKLGFSEAKVSTEVERLAVKWQFWPSCKLPCIFDMLKLT